MTSKRSIRIGLIGDHDPTVPAHQAIPVALRLSGEAVGADVEFDWLPTPEIVHASRVASFDGLWCVPASPYRNMGGALLAIRFAREQRRPFLGTCGGFQHAILEYARNVLGWADAEHAETAPDAGPAVIALRAGEVRAVDLDDHPFFVGTLFQPERAALKGQLPPLAAAFVRASATHAWRKLAS